jgi:hypothetical protein
VFEISNVVAVFIPLGERLASRGSMRPRNIPSMVAASPKISAFPVRRSELPVRSGKFLKNGMISVEFGRFW